MQYGDTIIRRNRVPRFFHIGVAGILLLGLIGSVVFFAWGLRAASGEIEALEAAIRAADQRMEENGLKASSELDEIKAEIKAKQAALDAKQEEIGRLRERVEELERELETARAMADPNQKIAYLTFDDGPSAHTPAILDILDEHDAPATFFVMNTRYPQYMKEITERGNAIGLHTYTHRYSEVYSSVDAFFEDLGKIAALVEEQTGRSTDLMRFAGGSSNLVSRKYTKGIMTTLKKEVVRRGYRYFDWNCDSGDALGENVPADKLIENVKKDVGTKKSVCILMHDSNDKRTTVEALPEIIGYLKSEGYLFATLDRTAAVFHHGVQN